MLRELRFKLLLKNTSPARVAGFVLSNFIGLAIIIGGIIFYNDAGALWTSDDSFIKSDYLVVNKKVTSSGLWGESSVNFTLEEIAELQSQPWVREVGTFTSNDYKVWASVGGMGGRNLSTMLFFESVPDEFVDGVDNGGWEFHPDDNIVPVIISKDYLALYNFGFAGSQNLPRLSASVMGSIPLRLTLVSEDGARSRDMDARIVGFSSRLNTILVPRSFMEWSNRELGSSRPEGPSRLIIDVSSPGDVAIRDYLESRSLELAGDKSSSSASYLIKVLTGVVLTVGSVITLLSLFILMLSVSLIMEKNRKRLHSLLMLGYSPGKVGIPYICLVVGASLLAYGLACLCGLLLRGTYIGALEGLGAHPVSPWVGLFAGAMVTVFIVLINIYSVVRRVRESWR